MAPIYQMTRLLATLGLAIAPQLMKPFLGYYYIDVNVNITADGNATVKTPPDYEGIQPIQLAFLTLASVMACMAIILVLTSTVFSIVTGKCTSAYDVLFQSNDEFDEIEVDPDESKAPPKSDSEPLKAETKPTRIDPFSRPGRILVFLIFVAFLMNAGTSVLYLSFMYTYLYEYLGWTVQAATSLCSLYQVARFIVGSVVVFVARLVSPAKIVIFDLCSMFLGSVMMLTALGLEGDAVDTLTTIGIMMSSFGDSNILPTLISVADQSVQVTATVMSLFIAASGVSMLVTGPMTGFLLNASVVAYPASLLTLISGCMLTLTVYFCILRWLKSSKYWPE